jgi:hypothetical protein
MNCKVNVKERIQELYDDEDHFLEFVEWWIEENRDTIVEIVSDYLEVALASGDYAISEDFYEFTESKVEGEVSECQDRAYDEYKEREFFEGGEKI